MSTASAWVQLILEVFAVTLALGVLAAIAKDANRT